MCVNGSQEKDHISPCRIYVMNCVMDNFRKIDGWGVEPDLAISVVCQNAVYTMKFNPQGTAIALGSHDKDIYKSSCISFELVRYCGSRGLPIKAMLIDHCARCSASGLLHGLQKLYISQFWNRQSSVYRYDILWFPLWIRCLMLGPYTKFWRFERVTSLMMWEFEIISWPSPVLNVTLFWLVAVLWNVQGDCENYIVLKGHRNAVVDLS
jgi:hypothetical protein